MSSGLEHRDCAETLGAYVLGALPEAESERVERHLTGCRECQAEIEWLRVAVDALPASVEQIEPPPELKDRVMKIVEEEADLLRAAGKAADQPPRSRRRRWRWPRGRLFSPAVAFAAACLIVAAVILVTTGGGTSTRTIRAQITSGARGARASLVVRGARAELVVTRLPAPAPNHVDELWVQHGSAPPQPAGTFVVSSGSVKVNRPVRSGDTVLVTVEPGGGTSKPTTQPFLVAHV